MGTAQQYLNITAKRLLGLDDFGARFLDYMKERAAETNKAAYDVPTVLASSGITFSEPASNTLRLAVAAGTICCDGLGNFLDPTLTELDMPFENATGTAYSVGVKHCTVPTGVQVNPRTGMPEYIGYEDQIGEQTDPDNVIDNGDSTLTLSVNGVTESGADCSDRKVLVYLKNPASGGISDVIAIEECTVVFVGSDNRIVTTGVLGQSTISTDAADYEVVALGTSIKKYEDLSSATGYTFLGTATGTGGGSFSSDYTGQVVMEKSWMNSLLTGIPHNLIPDVDNVRHLGDPTHRWASAYIDAIYFTGNFNPATNDTQNLGQPGLNWAVLYAVQTRTEDLHAYKLTLSSAASYGCINHFVSGTDDAYDLGNVAYRWRKTYTNALDVADEGIESNLIPDTDWTRNLGDLTHRWNMIYAKTITLYGGTGFGIASDLAPTIDSLMNVGTPSRYFQSVYTKWITLKNIAGNGMLSDFNPQSTDSFDLGNATYRWGNLYAEYVYGDHFRPSAHNTGGVGSIAATYQWGYFESFNISDKLQLLDTAGKGCEWNFNPTVANNVDLGNPTYYWGDVYADGIYYKTTAPTSFDVCDDLALVERYGNNPDTKEVVLNGVKRTMGYGNVEDIPWPMIGDIGDDGVPFVAVDTSLMFLLGAVKQLYVYHKGFVEASTKKHEQLKITIGALQRQLKSIQA